MSIYIYIRLTPVKTSVYVGLPRCRTTKRIFILYTFVSNRVLWSGDEFIYHLQEEKSTKSTPSSGFLAHTARRPDTCNNMTYYVYINERQIDLSESIISDICSTRYNSVGVRPSERNDRLRRPTVFHRDRAFRAKGSRKRLARATGIQTYTVVL